MKNKAKQKGALFSSLSTLSLRFSSPKSAGMPKQQGSKTSARLGADAKEQAGTANCLQTAQQKLTQLPDEAGTTNRTSVTTEQVVRSGQVVGNTLHDTTPAAGVERCFDDVFHRLHPSLTLDRVNQQTKLSPLLPLPHTRIWVE